MQNLSQRAIAEIEASRDYFNRSTRNLTEDHSTFAPAPGMMTAAQQVAHAAQTVDWFFEGAFRPQGFNMDFEGMAKETNDYTSLAKARAWFEKAIAHAKEVIADKSDAELLEPLPPGIMGGAPRFAVIGSLTDHTAHHRGALTVYARLKGVVPPMPYMET